MSELSDDTMLQTPHISTLQDSSPPPLETSDGLPQKTHPRTLPTTTSVDIDFLRDIYLWRRNNLSFTILLVATVLWVLLEIYKYNFITVASWIGIFFFTSMFFWANMHHLLKKEAPDISGMEMSEQSAMNIANTIKQLVETGGRWMFRVATDGEWFEFAIVVAALYLVSLMANCFDFLTFLYIGVVTWLTLPIIYVKYENNINQFGQSLRSHCERYYELIDDKLRKIRHRLVDRQEKIKKTD